MASRKRKPRKPHAPSPTARTIRLPYPKDENGRPLCRWCRTLVKKPRKSWCSDKCVLEYRERYDTSYQRSLVLKRDRGVCAGCSMDTVALARRVMARKGFRDEQLALVVGAGFKPTDLRFKRRGLCPLWQADHIVPVVEGGGGTTIGNIRTLCLICHRTETRKLMERRRAAKKALKETT